VGDYEVPIQVHYRDYSVGCPNGEIVIQIAGVLWYEQEPLEETPIGSSNINFIMQQGTLVIGWVGPALFAIVFAAFVWRTKVF
jgi:hypothetical protein